MLYWIFEKIYSSMIFRLAISNSQILLGFWEDFIHKQYKISIFIYGSSWTWSYELSILATVKTFEYNAKYLE